MPDFSKLNARPAGEAKRPPTMPGGDYPAIIKSYEQIESQQKHTPGIRYFHVLTDYPAGLPDHWSETDEEGKVWEYTREDLDLSKRQQRFEFWFPTDDATGEVTEGSLYRFDQFLRSCQIEPRGRSYEELFPAVVGQRIISVIKQQLNPQTNRLYAQVDRIVGSR